MATEDPNLSPGSDLDAADAGLIAARVVVDIGAAETLVRDAAEVVAGLEEQHGVAILQAWIEVPWMQTSG